MQDEKKKKKVSLIGVGMGNPDTLTVGGKLGIEAAEALIGAPRLLQPYESEAGKTCFASFLEREIIDYIDGTNFEKYAVLVSGDVGFYSAGPKYMEAFAAYELSVIPGISSLAYFCSRIRIPWEDVTVKSLHGRTCSLARAVYGREKVFVLTAGQTAEIGRNLTDFGLGDITVYVGEDLSYASERITCTTVGELEKKQVSPLSVLLFINPDYDSTFPFGLPDDVFVRGSVPMTKSEVRAVCISKMRLRKDSVVYDIGAGTGSVSIEAAMAAEEGRVYAIEQKEEAVALIEKNRKKFQTDNLFICHGRAAEILKGLPAPDVVFLGGTGGQSEAIFCCLTERFEQFRAVANAVTLEGITELFSLWKRFGMEEADIVQAAVSKAVPAGSCHLMNGQNPVFILSGVWRKQK